MRDILDQARAATRGERLQRYGNPWDSFSRIARLWSTYLAIEVTSHDVATMMVMLKCARGRAGYHEDSAVDIAGYAAMMQMLAEGKMPEEMPEATSNGEMVGDQAAHPTFVPFDRGRQGQA